VDTFIAATSQLRRVYVRLRGRETDWNKGKEMRGGGGISAYGGQNLSLPSAKQTGVQKRGEIDKENCEEKLQHTQIGRWIYKKEYLPVCKGGFI